MNHQTISLNIKFKVAWHSSHVIGLSFIYGNVYNQYTVITEYYPDTFLVLAILGAYSINLRPNTTQWAFFSAEYWLNLAL